MILEIDKYEPEHWLVSQVVRVVDRGGVVVIPTDTVYGVACDLNNDKAVSRLYELKGMSKKKLLSILCLDMGMASANVSSIPNAWFRTMRRDLPGPYTFILPAGRHLPRVMLKQRKTVGIRIPDCPIALELVRQLGRPLITTSIRVGDSWLNEPVEIEEEYGAQIDLVVDGGRLIPEPSTVIDLSEHPATLVRQGKGPTDLELD